MTVTSRRESGIPERDRPEHIPTPSMVEKEKKVVLKIITRVLGPITTKMESVFRSIQASANTKDIGKTESATVRAL